MTEPRVEAGDRALETAAIEIYAVVRRNLQGEETYEAVLGKIAALIQSAMNAQDKARLGTDWQELAEKNQETADKALALVDAMNAQARELVTALRNLIDWTRRYKNGWMGGGVLEEHLAEAERLLAERGEGR